MECIVCGKPAVFVCDFDVGQGRTCDAPLCPMCRINRGVTDYCPKHSALVSAQVVRAGKTIVIEDDGYPD